MSLVAKAFRAPAGPAQNSEAKHRLKPLADIPQIESSENITVLRPIQEGPLQPPDESPADEENGTLLSRASRSLVLLIERNRQLEEHVREVAGWAKDKISSTEQLLDAANQRADHAEQQLTRERNKLTAVNDIISRTFGLGSEAYDVIVAVEAGNSSG